MELKEGMILEQQTSDAIELDLQGKINNVINPHIEHWLIEDITSTNYVLYNLDNQRKWKIKKEDMKYYLMGNKRYGIYPMFTISKEVA